MKKINLNKKIM